MCIEHVIWIKWHCIMHIWYLTCSHSSNIPNEIPLVNNHVYRHRDPLLLLLFDSLKSTMTTEIDISSELNLCFFFFFLVRPNSGKSSRRVILRRKSIEIVANIILGGLHLAEMWTQRVTQITVYAWHEINWISLKFSYIFLIPRGQ